MSDYDTKRPFRINGHADVQEAPAVDGEQGGDRAPLSRIKLAPVRFLPSGGATPDVLPPAFAQQLREYAWRVDRNLVQTMAAVCINCAGHRTYDPEHPRKCRACFPDEPKSFEELLTDPASWLGPEYVWADWRGPRGRWVLLDGYFVCPREDLQRLGKAVGDLAGRSVIHAATELIKELRRQCQEDEHCEVASATFKRAGSEMARAQLLADKCGELEGEITRLRAECHRLSEENERHRRRGASR